jgi:hypothetical protein
MGFNSVNNVWLPIYRCWNVALMTVLRASPKMGRQTDRQPALPSLMEQLQSNGTIEEQWN